MKWTVWAAGLLLFGFACIPARSFAAPKATIGETAWIGVAGVPFEYLARIDTGARVTSIHAVDLHVDGGSEKPFENVGKEISFTSISRTGKVQKITGTIVKVSTVKNSQGIEQRYVIELTLSWKNVSKTVKVNLRDRSAMQYKLLIGRNWLSSNFLVDVDVKADEKGARQECLKLR